MLNDLASIERIEEEKMHRKRIRIGRRIFNLWVYTTFIAGILAEVCSIGYLLIHYYTTTIGG